MYNHRNGFRFCRMYASWWRVNDADTKVKSGLKWDGGVLRGKSNS